MNIKSGLLTAKAQRTQRRGVEVENVKSLEAEKISTS